MTSTNLGSVLRELYNWGRSKFEGQREDIDAEW